MLIDCVDLLLRFFVLPKWIFIVLLVLFSFLAINSIFASFFWYASDFFVLFFDEKKKTNFNAHKDNLIELLCDCDEIN